MEVRTDLFFGDSKVQLKNLYTKIIEPLGHQAKERNDDFIQSYSQMINKFTREFAETFCKNDGSINWEKLVQFNSGMNAAD